MCLSNFLLWKIWNSSVSRGKSCIRNPVYPCLTSAVTGSMGQTWFIFFFSSLTLSSSLHTLFWSKFQRSCNFVCEWDSLDSLFPTLLLVLLVSRIKFMFITGFVEYRKLFICICLSHFWNRYLNIVLITESSFSEMQRCAHRECCRQC